MAVDLYNRRDHGRCGPLVAGVLRRFDLEHTFRLFKQTLGWTRRVAEPAVRSYSLSRQSKAGRRSQTLVVAHQNGRITEWDSHGRADG